MCPCSAEAGASCIGGSLYRSGGQRRGAPNGAPLPALIQVAIFDRLLDLEGDADIDGHVELAGLDGRLGSRRTGGRVGGATFVVDRGRVGALADADGVTQRDAGGLGERLGARLRIGHGLLAGLLLEVIRVLDTEGDPVDRRIVPAGLDGFIDDLAGPVDIADLRVNGVLDTEAAQLLTAVVQVVVLGVDAERRGLDVLLLYAVGFHGVDHRAEGGRRLRA